MNGTGIQSLVGQNPQAQPSAPGQAPDFRQDPRVRAAIEVNNNGLESLGLSAEQEYALTIRDALNTVRAADNKLAMQQRPSPTNIIEQNLQELQQRASQGLVQIARNSMVGNQINASRRPPMPQPRGVTQLPSPNMARMAGGGIVAFQEGGDVKAVQEYIRLRAKLADPNTSPEAKQAIQQMMQDLKRMAGSESQFMLDVAKASGYDPAKEYEESMGGMYGGGVVGYAPGGYMSDIEREVRARLQQELGRQPRVQEIQDAVANEKLKRELESRQPEEPQRRDVPRRDYMSDIEREVRAQLQQELGRQPRVQEIQEAVAAERLRRNPPEERLNASVGRNRSRSRPWSSPYTVPGETPEEQPAPEPSATRDRMSDAEIMAMYALQQQSSPQADIQDNTQSAPQVNTQVNTQSAPQSASVSAQAAPSETSSFIADLLKRIDEDPMSAERQALVDFSKEQMGRDPETEAAREASRVDKYLGLQDRRQAYEDAITASREARAAQFDPDTLKRRRLQAALAQGAEQGLGGFGKGLSQEDLKIAKERIEAAEANEGDFKELVTMYENIGLKKVEAERQAVSDVRAAQLSGAQTLGQAVTTANTAANSRISALSNLATAEMSTSKPTDYERRVKNYVDSRRVSGDSREESEIRREYDSLQERLSREAAMAANQIRETGQSLSSTADYFTLAERIVGEDLQSALLSADEKADLIMRIMETLRISTGIPQGSSAPSAPQGNSRGSRPSLDSFRQ